MTQTEEQDALFEPDTLIGEVLANRYQIEARLGEGAMGTVFKAKHVKVGRAFAVKVLHSRLLVDGKVLQRFEREAELAGRLRHPNVIGVVDVGEMSDGTRYMVMDFAAGPDLATLLSEAPFPAPRVLNLTRQMLEGLYHAHEAGLIHRDFKPENVIIEKDTHGGEVPRIVDFGIAILREGGDSPSGTGRLTTNGLVLGTPHYMAPEQAVADPIDHRIDLFALGIIIYEMLCGKLPFDGTGAEVARSNLLLDPPPISERVPYLEVDPLLEAFARRLMAKKRDVRPATAKAARELLDLIDRDRPAAAAALGVPLETAARAPMVTQDSTPVSARAVSSNDTFPPPLRDQAPAMAAPVAAPVTKARPQLVTDVVRGAPSRKRLWIPLAIGAVAAAGIGIAVIAKSGSSDKTESKVVMNEPAAPPVKAAEPAPAPAPTPVEVAKQPDPPPPEVPDPPKANDPPKVVKTAAKITKPAVKRDEPKPPTPAPVVEAPKEPQEIDANTFAAQYKKVGEELAALEAKKGADAAADLWNRYRLIRYGETMSDQSKRDEAAATLAKIHQQIAGKK